MRSVERFRLGSGRRQWVAEGLLAERLPTRLHWLLARPKALRLALRLWPRWKPTFIQLQGYMTKASAEQFGKTWLREMAERGKAQPNVGVIYSEPDAMQRAITIHA